MFKHVMAGLLAGALLAGGAAAQQPFAEIRARGHLLCGVAGDLPGFSAPDQAGRMRGIDADYCRGVAAAVLGNPEAVRFIPQPTVAAGFAALADRSLDMLARNVTITASRDIGQPVEPAGIMLYDGQGILARGNAGIGTLNELDGKRVCVGAGGGLVAPARLARMAEQRGIRVTAVEAETSAAAFEAFLAGRCDAVTGDRSALAARRAVALPDPAAATLLPEVFSREPLSAWVRYDQPGLLEVVRWTLQAVVLAEEYGITQADVSLAARLGDREARALVGLEPAGLDGTGLGPDWPMRVIAAIGNYGELFERNLGAASGIGLDRGLNDLWLRGGLLYPLPIR